MKKGTYCSKCSEIIRKRKRKDEGYSTKYNQRLEVKIKKAEYMKNPEAKIRHTEAQKKYLLRKKERLALALKIAQQ